MRVVMMLAVLAVSWLQAVATDFESAASAVANMRVGWNLGNTLDSNSGDVNNMWIEKWTNRRPSDYETAWGQPITKPELMQMFKAAGFNAIRVPVTWYPHMEAQFLLNGTVWDKDNDDIGTQIQSAWMARVHEVVDYVISQGMYCILNIHHDTGAANTAWLIADEAVYSQQRERFETVWRQIAEEFKDYDEHLLFEGYNEMLDVKRSWCFASFAADNNYNAAMAASAYKAINNYAQSFVNAVRATGGNNSQRNLVVCTYGACDGSGTWSQHLKEPLTEMKLPEDETEGHLIFEVHSYPDIKSLTTAKKEVRSLVSNLNKHLVTKGAPVIIGEWGSSTNGAYENYRNNYLAFARYFIEQTKASDIATFHWMGLSDEKHRTVPKFNQQDLVDAIVKGYYGETGYSSIDATETDDESVLDIYMLNGTKVLHGVTRKDAVKKLKRGLYFSQNKKVFIR